MVAELVCVRPNGEWCLLDELRDYQDDGRFLEGDHETMSYECMMNRIAALAAKDRKWMIGRLQLALDKDASRHRQDNAEIKRLREAVTRLLACPVIADENFSDPVWGCAETREAEAFARAALAGKEAKP